MRTFLCLPVDPHLRKALGGISEELRCLVQVRASWVQAENFHVTVRFLGEIDPLLIGELERICRIATKQTPPFDLSIDRLGVFPSPARPRVVWAGGQAPVEFLRLVSSINEGLLQLGFPDEGKDSIAHITLARIKGRADRSVMQAIGSLNGQFGWTLHVDRLILMESRLMPSGPAYTPVFTLPFGGTDAV